MFKITAILLLVFIQHADTTKTYSPKTVKKSKTVKGNAEISAKVEKSAKAEKLAKVGKAESSADKIIDVLNYKLSREDVLPVEDGFGVASSSNPTRNPNKFFMTLRYYDETDNHRSACEDEFGSKSDVADFKDDLIQSGLSQSVIWDMMEDLGVEMSPPSNEQYFVTYKGDRKDSKGRTYFFEDHYKKGTPRDFKPLYDDHYKMDLGARKQIFGQVLCYGGKAPPTNPGCMDEKDFRYEGKSFQNCDWVGDKSDRRKKLCKETKVRRNCRKTCEDCDDTPTDSPTVSPTDAPTRSDDCEDDEDFKHNGKSFQNCDWVGDREDRRKRLCTENRDVLKNCPKTCKDCDNDECKNDKDFRHDGVSFQNCDWVGDKEDRKKRLCKDEREVRKNCSKTCKECDNDECKDDKDFRHDGVSFKNCDWIGDNEDRRKKLCREERDVLKNCPKTCKDC